MSTQVQEIRQGSARVAAVAANIRAEAARRRWTQSDLARRLGVSRIAISERHTGKTPWTVEQIEQCAGLFGVTFESLCAMEDSNLQPADYCHGAVVLAFPSGRAA